MKTIPYQANRTLGVLSITFTVAHIWEVRIDGMNLCRKVKRYKEDKRRVFDHFIVVPIDEERKRSLTRQSRLVDAGDGLEDHRRGGGAGGMTVAKNLAD